MPRPWKSNNKNSISGGSRAILNSPVCAALLGAVVAEWSGAESQLGIIYSELIVGTTMAGVPIAAGAWSAMETFDMISNFDQKRKMLVKAAERRGLEASIVEDLDKLLKALQKAGKSRIAAAHGRWGVDQTAYPESLIWTPTAGGVGEAMVYDASDFEADINRIAQRSGELMAFWRVTLHPKLEVATKWYIKHLRSMKDFEDPA